MNMIKSFREDVPSLVDVHLLLPKGKYCWRGLVYPSWNSLGTQKGQVPPLGDLPHSSDEEVGAPGGEVASSRPHAAELDSKPRSGSPALCCSESPSTRVSHCIFAWR